MNTNEQAIIEDGGPAFPRPPFTPKDSHDQFAQAGFAATGHPGMTLRNKLGVALVSDYDCLDANLAERIEAILRAEKMWKENTP
jgi:hypothetical protein